MANPKIVFVNRFFFPDVSATAQLLADLSFALADAGYSVSIVTSAQLYDSRHDSLPAREVVRGVNVYRCRSTHYGRESLAGRALDYLSFYLLAIFRLLLLLRSGDVVVVKTDPPMMATVLMPVAALRRARLVNWLQDIFPEIAGQLDTVPVKGKFVRSLSWLRDLTCRNAKRNVVISEGMCSYLLGRAVPTERVAVIRNWAPLGVAPVAREDNALRKEWQLDGRFVIGYSGNLGRAHDWRSIAALLEDMKEDPSVTFVFIGGGDGMDKLADYVSVRALANVQFRPYQSREKLGESLSSIDLHLVTLEASLAPLLVPSKIYGIAAVGRPAIFIGPSDSEVANIVQRYQFGKVVPNGDRRKLYDAAQLLVYDVDVYEKFCENARQAFHEHFAFDKAFSEWQRLLIECGGVKNAVQEIGRSN